MTTDPGDTRVEDHSTGVLRHRCVSPNTIRSKALSGRVAWMAHVGPLRPNPLRPLPSPPSSPSSPPGSTKAEALSWGLRHLIELEGPRRAAPEGVDGAQAEEDSDE